ncbi:MAG: PQQ-binding-like beta-propeller repeat protein [bacterium]
MSQESPSSKALYRMACAMAVVSCAFSLLVGILLISNTMAIRMASPLELPELDHLRTSLKASPADETVRNKIRDLDQVVRHLYFTGLASRRTGSLLLLAGIALSLTSIKAVAILRRRQPDPREYPVATDPLKAESAARWAVAAAGAVIVAITVFLGRVDRDLRARSVPDKHPSHSDAAGTSASTVNTSGAPVQEAAISWSSFRGASGSGVASSPNFPVAWDGATGSGILWKVEIPLPGMSLPVVCGNKVYLTGASTEKREVYCYDIATGTRLWQVEAKGITNPPKKVPEIFQDTGYAAPTSVSDDRVVCSIFANGDVIAIDPCAKPLWTLDLGLPFNRYGHASSLAGYQDTIVIQYDQDVEKKIPSRLIALNAITGKQVWSTPRKVSDSWSSPIVVKTEKRPQVITMANDAVIAYDAASGRELWTVKCRGSDVGPSPIYAGGLVLASITGDRIYAIRPDGAGDVTATHVAWTSEDGVADVSSPVSNGELVFFVHSGGLVTCLETKTGKKVWDHNLDGEFYGSPGLAGDKLYLVARNGTVFILKAGRQFEEIGKAALGEPSDGSPVFAGDRILIRGIKALYCIGNKAK